MSGDNPKKVLMVVHRPESETGRVGRFVRENGYEEEVCRLALGHALPETLTDYAGVVIFGGPMSVHDTAEFPFLNAERDWIARHADGSTPMLGICLGAQLIATALGGNSVRHPQEKVEVGYYPLFSTEQGLPLFPREMHAFQWHGDAIIAPPGAELLATGDTFAVQAFRMGQAVVGIQFHPEVSRAMHHRWIVRAGERLAEPGAQTATRQLGLRSLHDPQNVLWLDQFMRHWLGEEDPC